MVILLPELLAGQGSAVWAVAGSQLLLQVWNQLILDVVLFFTYLWNREGSQISNCLFSHPLDYLQEGSKTVKGLQLLLKKKIYLKCVSWFTEVQHWAAGCLPSLWVCCRMSSWRGLMDRVACSHRGCKTIPWQRCLHTSSGGSWERTQEEQVASLSADNKQATPISSRAKSILPVWFPLFACSCVFCGPLLTGLVLARVFPAIRSFKTFLLGLFSTAWTWKLQWSSSAAENTDKVSFLLPTVVIYIGTCYRFSCQI